MSETKLEPTISDDTFDPYDCEDTGEDSWDYLPPIKSKVWKGGYFTGGEANTPDEDEPFLGSAKASQVGGDHYIKLKIQPMEYSMANELNALQHTAIKYITRYQDKGTPLTDLAKARHCIDMMIEDWMENHE